MLRDCYLAADVYLVGFPLGSMVSMLDAGLYGIPIQRMRLPGLPDIAGDDISLEGALPFANDESEYVRNVMDLLSATPTTRNQLSNVVRTRILRDHCGSSWVQMWLEPIIQQALDLKVKSASNASASIKDEVSACEREFLTVVESERSNAGNTILLSMLRSFPRARISTKASLLFQSLLRIEPLRSASGIPLFLLGLGELVLQGSLVPRIWTLMFRSIRE